MRVFRLTVLLQIGLQSGNEFSFVSLGFQTSGLTLLPQFSKLRTTRETETVLLMQHLPNVPCCLSSWYLIITKLAQSFWKVMLPLTYL